MDIKKIKLIDKYIGTPVCIGLSPLKLLKKKNKINKILVIMFWGIGSNIAALPSLKELKKTYPQSRITVLAPEKNKDLFYKNEFIDELKSIELSLKNTISFIKDHFQHYDLVIDMEHYLNISAIIAFLTGKKTKGFSNRNIRNLLYNEKIEFNPKAHAVCNNLRLINQKQITIDQLEKIKTSEQDKKFAAEFLMSNKINPKDLIIICPGSGPTASERRWPRERFAETADYLIKNNNEKIVFIGTDDEADIIDDIQKNIKEKTTRFTGKSLGKLIALIDLAKLVISNDTGPMHIAAAQNKKTIGLFGPETPVIFGAFGKNTINIYKNAPCSPSIIIYKGIHKRCKGECMKEITVKEVIDAAEKLLRSK